MEQKMTLYLIRHAATAGNEARRYIGATDQPLSPNGEAACLARRVPPVQAVFASPMLRCRQTASFLFAGVKPVLLDALREYDFGILEGKTHAELAHLAVYRQWVEAGGRTSLPDAEEWEAFHTRCENGFVQTVDRCVKQKVGTVAIVTHGGVIMAMLERFGVPKKGFYEWQAENLGGWVAELRPQDWVKNRRLISVEPLA